MTVTPILWLLGFFPALVALYFLKLKRRDVIVSSTLLWKRSLEDLHVNAPFQKLRRSWLLLLQMVILAALIFSIWRPKTVAPLGTGRNLIVLLDNSASTQARERDGVRFELERKEALKLVQGMGDTDRMALFTFASKTTLRQPLTRDKVLLESRIKELGPTALPTDLEQALRVAGSFVETLASPEVHVIGDGSYGDLSALPPEVKRMSIKFLGKGTALDNIGITEMDVRRSFEAKQKTEVFAMVENFGRALSRITVSFRVDGELKDAREVDIPSSASVPVIFDASSVEEGIASISTDADDALLIDNQAWAQISRPETVSVLVVGKPNPWIDLVLKATGGVRFRRMGGDELSKLVSSASPGELEKTLSASVLIFDRETIPAPPPLPAIYFASKPPLPPSVSSPETKKLPAVVDWDRAHPVNRFLVFTELYIEESAVFRPGDEYRSLVDSDGGSIMGIVRYPSPGQRAIPAILVGFDILKSNWPLGHYSFPIFFSNAVSWLASLEGGRKACLHTGESLVYYPGRGEDVEALQKSKFRAPGGTEFPALQEAGGAFIASAAEEAGVYQLLCDGKVRASFPVSLLSSSESRLTPSPRVDLGDSIEVKSSIEEGERDLWKWFGILAFLFLLLEWHVYNRKLV